jgi:protein-S-isoprenylcysteine O-methyltransferase Ste14
VRYLGLALFAAGGLLRVGPMLAMGHLFSARVAIQEGHRLVTTGYYRLVRHPSYLGVLLAAAGWCLVFRSGYGLLLALPLVPLLASRISAEEVLLEAEFGEAFADYRRRTWRLIPFVY